jgi:hypothetical protein
MVQEDSRCDIAPDGTKVYVLTVDNHGYLNNQVELHRPGGQIVQLTAANHVADPAASHPAASQPPRGVPGRVIARAAPPLTVAQLVEIGNALHA